MLRKVVKLHWKKKQFDSPEKLKKKKYRALRPVGDEKNIPAGAPETNAYFFALVYRMAKFLLALSLTSCTPFRYIPTWLLVSKMILKSDGKGNHF